MTRQTNSDSLPKIKIKWKRGHERIDWSSPRIFLGLGKKDSGKSAFNEACALRYPQIIDLFGSRDNEGLCWCRKTSPIDNILLIHGENVDLSCSWDTVGVGDLTWQKMKDYECITMADSFFHDQEERFTAIEKIIDQFWSRLYWKHPISVIIREASSFIYSRMRQWLNIKEAKADFIYFQREMRHFGFSLLIDSIRWHSIDKELRDLSDYLIIKRMGHQGLPKDISFLYKFVHPMSLARLKAPYFLILTEQASIGFGKSELPAFHKEEGVDLVRELGIQITKGERIEESTLQQVGNQEHVEIVNLYREGTSMVNIGRQIHRSSGTVHGHIKRHNQAVARHGYCLTCSKLDEGLSRIFIEK